MLKTRTSSILLSKKHRALQLLVFQHKHYSHS
nr:MAG TPA: hypothetical protein [Bacteriophage sp.]